MRVNRIKVSCRIWIFAFNLILCSAVVLFSQFSVRADQSVTLTWNPSSATNIAGYKIYYGPASHNYTNVVVVGNTTSATISGLVAGTTYFFSATTFDGAGDESAFSNEASYAVPLNTPTITALPTASPITYGQTLASSGLSGGMASTEGSFAFATPELAPDAGTANVAVTFTPTDTNDYTTATATVAVSVNQALATVTLGNLNQSFDGTAKPVSATTSPDGLNVGMTYNASSLVPTNAGSYTVIATVNDPNYTGSATNILVIGRATATVTLGNLNQSYDGTAKPASATTSPAGLNMGVTYNASSQVPTNAGSYVVVATVNDPNYTGSATNILVIGRATATVTLGNLNQSYDGAAKPVSATTSPDGLNVGMTYNASSLVPTNAGSYVVVATVNDPNYTGSATNILVIGQATATVTLGNLIQTYDGTAKLASMTTSPAGLNVGMTYNATSQTPTNAGSYVVVATMNDPNYTGSATNILVIGQATATVTLGNLKQKYDGTAKLVTASTTPANLAVVLNYNGSDKAPVAAGSYIVVGTITDPNYQGSTVNTLNINPATLQLATLTSALRSGGQFSFTVSGLVGQKYVVQASTNLIDWDSVQTNTAPFVFTDTAAENFSQRFYRTYSVAQ